MAFKAAKTYVDEPQKDFADQKKLRDFVGSLVLVTPTEYCEEVPTELYGPKDAVRIDFVVLDGPDAGEQVEGDLCFNGRIIKALKYEVGNEVLGRVAKGASKQGQPALQLDAPTAADIAVANAAGGGE